VDVDPASRIRHDSLGVGLAALWGDLMQIDPFDESLIHRKILSHDPAYRDMFRRVQEHVQRNLKTVELIRIGSPAIPDLRGKPMVDITAVTNRADLRRTAGVSESASTAGMYGVDDKPMSAGR
jgi:GrpB-like predicted nucleotidyltransferase (UPF0157 family)